MVFNTILNWSKSALSGPNIMQLLVYFYPVNYTYLLFLSILVFVFLIILFYVYTDSLRPLLVLAPVILFLFSWKNSTTYVLPFIPFLILIYYEKRNKKVGDLIRNKQPIVYGFAIVLVVAFVALLLAHNSYQHSNTLNMTNVSVITHSVILLWLSMA